MKARSLLLVTVAALLACVVLFMVGCASFTTSTYRTLSIAKETRDVGLKSAADLYHQGKINDEQKVAIIKVANEYRDAYFVAVDALLAYTASKNADDETKLETALVEFADVSAKFTGVLQKYIK